MKINMENCPIQGLHAGLVNLDNILKSEYFRHFLHLL